MRRRRVLRISTLSSDDTVLLATNREVMQNKLERLINQTNEIDMKVHPSKSVFIKVTTHDEAPFLVGSTVIRHVEKYKYLGSEVSNSTITMQLNNHVSQSNKNLVKFQSFLARNPDAPFQVKRAVWESALFNSILYSCETWISANFSTLEKVYMQTAKSLLGVRNQTSNDMVRAELGIPTCKALVKQRQKTLLTRIQRDPFSETPVAKAMRIALRARSPMALHLDEVRTSSDVKKKDLHSTKDKIARSTSTRMSTYLKMNPSLESPTFFSQNLPEHVRIPLTRLRLSAHYLKVETGKWSRLPLESRLCSCGDRGADGGTCFAGM